MKRILLTRGKVALVDDEDFLKIQSFKWYFESTGYAVRKPRRGKMYMHRIIMNNPNSQVDHINGDKLDNRKANLRLATAAENRRNKAKKSDNTSGYKGVTRRRNKWIAQIQCAGQHYYLGIFEFKEDAAKAYNDAATKLHGRFAKLNEV